MKVLLSICAHRYLEPRSVDCLIRTILSSDEDIQFGYSFQLEPMIDRARAMQAMDFLKTDFDVLLFLDDDILYNVEDVHRLAEDAIEKQSIVCGPYAKKTEGAGIIAIPLKYEEFPLGPDGKLLEIRWGGTGFMAVPRIVFETLSKDMELVKVRKDIEIWPFFMPFVCEADGELIDLSEDFAFCENARNAGFKVWLDTRIALGHIGPKVYVPGSN